MASSTRETKPSAVRKPDVMCFGSAAVEEVVTS